MAGESDYESLGINVLLRVREGDRRLPEFFASFSNGEVVGLESDGEQLIVALRIGSANWAGAVSYVESRLDRLGFDWRQHASCTRP